MLCSVSAAGDVIPPSSVWLVFVRLREPNHLETILVCPAIWLIRHPVAVLPGGVVKPAPGALQVLVSSSNEDGPGGLAVKVTIR